RAVPRGGEDLERPPGGGGDPAVALRGAAVARVPAVAGAAGATAVRRRGDPAGPGGGHQGGAALGAALGRPRGGARAERAAAGAARGAGRGARTLRRRRLTRAAGRGAMGTVTDPREPTDTDVEVTRAELRDASQPSARGKRGPSLPRGAMVRRYVILELLGAGGMGEVFSAYDPELDRRIALKLVKPRQKERTQEARSRLLREAQALAKLSHPNVVAVYDVGEHGDRVFIAMEHVEGRTMHAFIDAGEHGGGGRRWQEGLRLML